MTYKPTPTHTEGGRDYVTTADENLLSVLTKVLEQLQIMNFQLSSVTETVIDEVG